MPVPNTRAGRKEGRKADRQAGREKAATTGSQGPAFLRDECAFQNVRALVCGGVLSRRGARWSVNSRIYVEPGVSASARTLESPESLVVNVKKRRRRRRKPSSGFVVTCY